MSTGGFFFSFLQFNVAVNEVQCNTQAERERELSNWIKTSCKHLGNSHWLVTKSQWYSSFLKTGMLVSNWFQPMSSDRQWMKKIENSCSVTGELVYAGFLFRKQKAVTAKNERSTDYNNSVIMFYLHLMINPSSVIICRLENNQWLPSELSTGTLPICETWVRHLHVYL